MTLRHVIIELLPPAELDAALMTFGPRGEPDRLRRAVAGLTGFTPDLGFGALRSPDASRDTRDLTAAPPAPETILIRGVIDDEQTDLTAAVAADDTGVVGIFADCAIASYLTCGHSPARGDHHDVARLLGVSSLHRAGMTGAGVALAIVDSGINLAHLRARLGFTPRLDQALSWLPSAGEDMPDFVPGAMPVGHGTMCAFDALIAAPEATLLDLPILDPRLPAGIQHRLSDAIRAFDHLVRVAEGLGSTAGHHSLVVNNSWGLYQAAWDLPPGDPGRYIDNPRHPFNRIVGRLERAGADILFAAGNCGSECPDGRCGTVRDEGILGANSHPDVLCVAGVDIAKRRVGYSTRGPGLLTAEKPDIAGFTHFHGSGWLAADSGTSAACPVVAGLLAACRSRLPLSDDWRPARMRSLLRDTADPLDEAGFNPETGYGIASGTRLLDAISAGSDAPTDADAPRADEPSDDPDPLPNPDDEIADEVEDDEFLCALMAFEAPATGGKGCTGCDPCADGSPCAGRTPATESEDETMSDRDQEFLQALQKFGGPISGGQMLSATDEDDDFDDLDAFEEMDDMDDDQGEDDDAFFAALSQYGGPAMGMAQGGVAAQDMTAAPAVAQLCRVWRSARPIVRRIISFIRAIPGIGGSLANAANTLTRLLDAICNGTNPAALCRQWRGGLRTIVLRIASVVRRIPLIGSRAARAIRSLVQAIDAVCRLVPG